MLQASMLLFEQDMGQGLQGFTQSHVIGQHAAHFQLPQALHPAKALQLIGAQLRCQTMGRV